MNEKEFLKGIGFMILLFAVAWLAMFL